MRLVIERIGSLGEVFSGNVWWRHECATGNRLEPIITQMVGIPRRGMNNCQLTITGLSIHSRTEESLKRWAKVHCSKKLGITLSTERGDTFQLLDCTLLSFSVKKNQSIHKLVLRVGHVQ